MSLLLLFRPGRGAAPTVTIVTGMFDDPNPSSGEYDEPTPSSSNYDEPSPSGAMYDEPTPS